MRKELLVHVCACLNALFNNTPPELKLMDTSYKVRFSLPSVILVEL